MDPRDALPVCIVMYTEVQCDKLACRHLKRCKTAIFLDDAEWLSSASVVRHLGFLKLKFLTVVHFRDMFCISVTNFVYIGHTVARISRFFAFSSVIQKKFTERSRLIWHNFFIVRDNYFCNSTQI